MDVDKFVSRLDALINEVHTLAEAGVDNPRLVHALRNLAHVAGLLATLLSTPDVLDLMAENERSSA